MSVHAFISSRLDYCNSLFTCLNKTSIDKLQLVHNAAARLLTRSKKSCHITPILASLHWLPVHYRIHFKVLTFTFRAIHGQAPIYITELIHPYTSTRSLRSADQHLLDPPKTNLKTKGDRAFEATAARLWNALPLDLKKAPSEASFKKHLKTHLFRQAFGHLLASLILLFFSFLVCFLIYPFLLIGVFTVIMATCGYCRSIFYCLFL